MFLLQNIILIIKQKDDHVPAFDANIFCTHYLIRQHSTSNGVLLGFSNLCKIFKSMHVVLRACLVVVIGLNSLVLIGELFYSELHVCKLYDV